MRKAVLAAALAAAFVVAASAASAPRAETRPRPAKDAPTSAAQAAPPKADADGDKLFEDIERRANGRGPRDELPVLVRIRGDVTDERLAEIERRIGAFAVGRRFDVVDGFAARVTRGQLERLSRLDDVVHVEENSRVRVANETAQASFGASQARWEGRVNGNADGPDGGGVFSPQDIVIAIVDTGIDASHQDLDEGKVLAFHDVINGQTAPYDDEGHGTHVAATAAGDGDATVSRQHRGVAPEAALVGVKVLDGSGNGTLEGVVAGVEWVVANKATYGIEIMNLSLGASGCSDGTDLLSQAVNTAVAAGIVVVVAAGNDGPGRCTIGSPGAAADPITVGAMADFEQLGFYQAWFSSRGPTFDGRIKPDVSAPGVAVTSAAANTGAGYATFDGTSMATPFVAGVAALMLDANPALTPAQVKATIRSTAVDWARGGDNTTLGTTGPDVDYGAGRLDAYAAVRAVRSTLVSPPSMPTHALVSGSLSGDGAIADFPITVTDPTFPIAATMIIASLSSGSASTPDFDLYLYSPSGTLLASSLNVTRQEEVAAMPTVTGTYKVRVESWSGSGPFFVDLSYGTASCRGLAATIVGTMGADNLAGTAGNDVIVAFAGNDTIDGGGGDDVICAGAGDDVVTVAAGSDDVDGQEGSDTLNATLGALGAVEFLDSGLTGTDGVAVTGTAAADAITVAGYEVTSGTQSVDAGWPEAPITVTGGGGDDTIYAASAHAPLVLHGGGGNDRVTGGREDDELTGGDGADNLDGRGGDDTVSGGPGVDTMTFTSGADVGDGHGGGDSYVVRLGSGVAASLGDTGTDGSTDRLTVYGTAAADSIAVATATVTAGSETVALAGIEGPYSVLAVGGNDVVDGSAATVVLRLYGGYGDDVLDGGSAGDTVTGDAGADVARGRGGNDRLQLRDSAVDDASCGLGTDTVTADLADSATTDCETVNRA